MSIIYCFILFYLDLPWSTSTSFVIYWYIAIYILGTPALLYMIEMTVKYRNNNDI